MSQHSAANTSAAQRVWAIVGVFAYAAKALRQLLALPLAERTGQNPKTRKISASWARSMLKITKLDVTIDRESAALSDEPCLYVANHVGYMDIPVILSAVPVSFVAKKEVRRWFVIGAGAAAIGTVFIDRESASSRRVVAEALATAIVGEKKNIMVFPEGTSSPYGKAWKRGVFHLAKTYGFKIQSIRLAYRPHRLTTYWGRDNFVFHLWRLVGLPRIEASMRIFPAESIHDIEADCERMRLTVQRSLHEKLAEWGEEIDADAVAAINDESDVGP